MITKLAVRFTGDQHIEISATACLPVPTEAISASEDTDEHRRRLIAEASEALARLVPLLVPAT